MKGEQHLHSKMHFSSISPASFSSAHPAPQLGTDTSSRQVVKSPLTTLGAECGRFQHGAGGSKASREHRRVHPCQDTAQGTQHIPAPRCYSPWVAAAAHKGIPRAAAVGSHPPAPPAAWNFPQKNNK